MHWTRVAYTHTHTEKDVNGQQHQAGKNEKEEKLREKHTCRMNGWLDGCMDTHTHTLHIRAAFFRSLLLRLLFVVVMGWSLTVCFTISLKNWQWVKLFACFFPLLLCHSLSLQSYISLRWWMSWELEINCCCNIFVGMLRFAYADHSGRYVK